MANHSFEVSTYDDDSNQIDFTIEVNISGGYHAATWGYDGGSPAEGPEWDLEGIYRDQRPVELAEFLTAFGKGRQAFNSLIAEEVDNHFRESQDDRDCGYDDCPDYDYEPECDFYYDGH